MTSSSVLNKKSDLAELRESIHTFTRLKSYGIKAINLSLCHTKITNLLLQVKF